MIDSKHLLPPVSGPSTNPILFAISEGLARLLPLPEDDAFGLSRIAAAGEGAVPAPASAASRSDADRSG